MLHISKALLAATRVLSWAYQWSGQALKDLTFTFTYEEIIKRGLNEPTSGVG